MQMTDMSLFCTTLYLNAISGVEVTIFHLPRCTPLTVLKGRNQIMQARHHSAVDTEERGVGK